MSTLSELNANPLLCAGHLKPSLHLLTDILKMSERRERKRNRSHTKAWHERDHLHVCLSSFIVSFWHLEVRFGVLWGRLEEPWLSMPAFPAFLTPQQQGQPGSLCSSWKPLHQQQQPPLLPRDRSAGTVQSPVLAGDRRHDETARSGKSELAQILASPRTQPIYIKKYTSLHEISLLFAFEGWGWPMCQV